MSLDEMKMINVCHFLKYICWEWGSGGGVHNSPVNIDNNSRELEFYKFWMTPQ